jgi:hypothetical protein
MEWILNVLTLHRAYYLTDVLLLYTLLMLAATPMLALLDRGRAKLVLASSWVLWALWQVAPQAAQVPWQMVGGTGFEFSAWQVLFVSGLVLGFHSRSLASRASRIPIIAVLTTSALLALALIALYRVDSRVLVPLVPWSQDPAQTVAEFFYKWDVRPGRLVGLAIFGTLGFSFATVAWRPLRSAAGWLLLPLGQNALCAYALHVFVVALVTAAGSALRHPAQASAPESTAIQLASIIGIWAAIVLRPHANRVRAAFLALAPAAPPIRLWRSVAGEVRLLLAAAFGADHRPKRHVLRALGAVR